MGHFYSIAQKVTTNKDNDENGEVPYYYRILFDKYLKFKQINKKLFKCILLK